MTEFDLSSVFATVAAAIPDHECLVWRDRRLTYAQMNTRIDGVAHYLTSVGLGCHTERSALAGHDSGQDHLGIYVRNGNEYLETMIGSYRARVAPFNVNFRYVEEELNYLLSDAGARALVYGAEFAPSVAAIRDQLPRLQVLIQIADDSGNELLPGAVDYESITATPPPAGERPHPTGDDLFILYTGGTTGMPKGVLWRQHDMFISSMGGRPFGRAEALESYEALAAHAAQTAGVPSLLILPPFMHAAAQWAAFHMITMGGRIVIPDDVTTLRPHDVLDLVAREKVLSIPIVGDAVARPLLDALESGNYDLSGLATISNGAAPLTPAVRNRLLAALPHILLSDGVGASETGIQMSSFVTSANSDIKAATFTPQHDTAVVSEDLTCVLAPGGGQGWLARREHVPLGYLGDAAKTAKTFPVIDGVRWSIPGDRATMLDDGSIELLGRDSVTINSGGEKIFAEEVERAVAAHPDVYDVVVVGRPSERWGNEVVAVVQLADGAAPGDSELTAACRTQIAGYKVPKAFVRVAKITRSPAGKADYRWAKAAASAAMEGSQV
ncbi:acyl-CoA synthetase [Aldersonia kunmingensis]|uniref:acyl-CoA synthetase n=1 Tax=Aldersonia kunmingensis TaxID=408066 RepID=UPI000836E140|nr:acyl-CoA synthetase [Aldersonia kunmingensis]